MKPDLYRCFNATDQTRQIQLYKSTQARLKQTHAKKAGFSRCTGRIGAIWNANF